MKIIRLSAIKYIFLYILFLNILKYIICQKNIWNYNKCKTYLNKLDIICNKISKIDMFSVCQIWETKDPSAINKIPKNCQNKKYILPLLIKNSNPPIKKDCVINTKIKLNPNEKNKNIEDLTKNDQEIQGCIKTFEKFVDIFSVELNEDEEEDDIEDLDPLLELRKKLNISNFCVDFSLNLISELEKNLKSKTIRNISRISKDEVKFNDYIFNKLYAHYQKENNDNICIDNREKEPIKYFETKKKINNQNFDENNELETYNIKSKKDCVEYGLKSSNEEVLICTKYE